jgi:hypothetical protein
MSQQNIYQVQLLNDLHNYFPDVLYNPGRFRNVQDLLQYVRQVADTSPYTRGQAIYNNHQVANARTFSARQPTTDVPIYQTVQPIQSLNTIWTQPVTTVVEDTIPTTRIRVPLNTTTNTMLMNTLLGSVFGDLFSTIPEGTLGGDVGIQTFLNQRVSVYPTEEEINRATSVFRSTSRQDDICAICQDDIEANQEFRSINHCNHYFHSDCIDTWFTSNVHCPTCRHDIRELTDSTRNVSDETNTPQNNPPPVPDRRTNINENN